MKLTRRRKTFHIAIVASIVFVVCISSWRATRSARIPAGQVLKPRSTSLDFSANAGNNVRTPSARPSRPVLQQFANFPLAFEANQGQTDQRIKFLARGANGQLQLAANSVTMQFKRSSLSVRFAGANETPRMTAEAPLVERRNFLLGNDRSEWHTDVPTFRRVKYEQLYSGIDLTF